MSILSTKKGFFTKLKEFFVGKAISDDLFEELEELLIKSDMGIKTSLDIIQELETQKFKDTNELYNKLEEILENKINFFENTKLNIQKGKLNIILIVGVNGVGKTSSIAKLANILKNQGNKIVIAAADTFRAAAIEQIELWANKIDVKLIKHSKGSDPAAVVFDTLNFAKKENYDVAIIDTAGRLHNKKDLMNELLKIRKIIDNNQNDANIETLLVIDSTTGQNGLEQAKIFNEICELSGLILTKYDGTAKGGIIFPIIDEIKKPVKFLGLGEGINDLKEFDSKQFIKEIFEKKEK